MELYFNQWWEFIVKLAKDLVLPDLEETNKAEPPIMLKNSIYFGIINDFDLQKDQYEYQSSRIVAVKFDGRVYTNPQCHHTTLFSLSHRNRLTSNPLL